MQFISCEVKDKVAVLSINRPPVNALNAQTAEEIMQALDEIEKMSDIRAVVITGSGEKCFVAGADITQFQGLNGQSSRPMTKRFQDCFNKIDRFFCPVIAAVNGLALGGGCELILACDVRVAAENAKFGQPEVGLGLIPGGGGTQRLPRLIAEGKAKMMIFGALQVNAQEAERIGLVDVLAPKGQALDVALELANKIACMAPIAVKQAKKAVNEGLDLPLFEGVERELDLSCVCFDTSDIVEGVAAFLEKRQANYANK